ncbi:ABC transporter permease [Kushneria phosphatilytica]|nr:ABC transporter permease [Kushneria phosphatilytica]
MTTSDHQNADSRSTQGPAATKGKVGGFSGVGRKMAQWREASILLAAIVLVIYFQATSPAFLTINNIGVLSQFATAVAIIAAGEVMVLICGELDLSVGQVYALTPFVMYFAQQAGLPLGIAIVLGLVVAALIGLINGLITIGLGVSSFVTTLGMLFFIQGLTLTISGGFPVQPEAGDFWTAVLGGNVFGALIWMAAIALIFQFILFRTRWGLHTIATGGNPLGASQIGIRTGRIKIGNFMLCSMLGGLAGILDAFRIGSIDPLSGGTEIMFMAIASAVIGGTLLSGGSGTVIGALLGALVLAILKDGFTISGVSAYTFDMILGLAIVITMIMNVHLSRLRARGKT